MVTDQENAAHEAYHLQRLLDEQNRGGSMSDTYSNSSDPMMQEILLKAEVESNKRDSEKKRSDYVLSAITSSTDMDHHAKQMRSKMMYDQLLSKTGSKNSSELIDRFLSSKRLGESLRGHQNLAESRVAQLRTENSELLSTVSEIQYAMGVVSKGGTSAKDAERDSRNLEQSLERVNFKMVQEQRNSIKSAIIINDIKAGVEHIVKILESNANLLKNIPTSAAPKIVSDDDISRALAWCEERVIAVNEALVLDASKPAGIDDTVSLPTRQIELARLVQGMIKSNSPPKEPKIHKREGKRLGAISEDIVKMDSLVDITPRAVLVSSNEDPSLSASDQETLRKDHNQELDLIGTVRSRRFSTSKSKKIVDNLESPIQVDADESDSSSQQFLRNALNTHDAKEALRKANFLANKKQGRNAGYGFVLSGTISNMKQRLNQDS